MIKSFGISVFILLCASLINTAILSNITVLPGIPDLSLLCVLYISIQNGKLMGESVGFVSGLFLDFLSAGPFGLNCLYRTFIGFLGGMFNKTLNTEGVFVPMLLAFSVTVLKGLLLWLLCFLYPSDALAYSPISWSFLFELGLNTFLAPFIFKFLSFFKGKLILRPEVII